MMQCMVKGVLETKTAGGCVPRSSDASILGKRKIRVDVYQDQAELSLTVVLCMLVLPSIDGSSAGR